MNCRVLSLYLNYPVLPQSPSRESRINAYEALVTYDDYNDDMEKSTALQEQVKTLRIYWRIQHG